MATDIMVTQPLGGPHYGVREHELDSRMDSDLSNLYGTHDDWVPPTHGDKRIKSETSYVGFSPSNTPNSDIQFRLNTDFGLEKPSDRRDKRSHDMASKPHRPYNTILASRADLDAQAAPLPPTNPAMYSSPSMFTPTNGLANSQDPTTISSQETRFEDDVSAFSNGPFSFSSLHTPETPNFLDFSAERQQIPVDRRRDSLQANYEAKHPNKAHISAGRRRRTEHAEPGSARAIYLEKNRKAASKCRNKQKMQQEDLVEMAREAERRNRTLKQEAEMLRSDMRNLMEIVSHHSECPDSRLRTYVQREADRLAAGGIPIHFFPPPPPPPPHPGGSPSGGMGTPRTASGSDRI